MERIVKTLIERLAYPSSLRLGLVGRERLPRGVSFMSSSENWPLSAEQQPLQRGSNLHAVHHSDIRISLHDKCNVLPFVTFKRIGVVNFVALFISAARESLAIRADVSRYIAIV